MNITEDDLIARGACKEGVDAFKAKFPGGQEVETVRAVLRIGGDPAWIVWFETMYPEE